MNITLSADPKLIEQSRKTARQQGTSLNALIRAYLVQLSGQTPNETAGDEFKRLALGKSGCSPEGFVFDREATNTRE